MNSANPLIGRQFANFQILRLLGQGGMAEVYYGWDVKLQRPVAIKVIHNRYREDPFYAERFITEARAMAGWHHPNIIPIYYADDEHGFYYYAMEYIHGLDLERVLREYARRKELIPYADVIRIGRAAAEALDYAHWHGVIHRDVKPSNLLIAADGRIMLTDFGLAMVVDRGTLGEVFGSPHYMAPEQARNSAEVVPQSDIYSLGIMLYEMVTGALPFNDPSPTTLALQQMNQKPPLPRAINPNLSPEVEAVLLKALSKAPHQRYPSGAALMDALETVLSVPAATQPYLAPKPGQTTPAPGRRLSNLAVVDLVRNFMETSGTPEQAIRQPPAPTKAHRLGRLAWVGIGCGLLLILGVVMAGGILSAIDRPQVSLPPSPIQTAWTTQVVVNPTVIIQIPSPTIPPAPTETSPPEATQAEITTESPPTPTVESGDLFVLFYDESSFYIKNLSGHDRSIYPLTFERIEKNDKFGSRFDGWVWANIYPTFESNYCLVIELIEYEDHLDPPECENRELVVRTPNEDENLVFWTKARGNRQFRVLWNEQEVGRCIAGKETCEVFLPE